MGEWWDWLVPGISVALEIALILLLVRRDLWRRFPVFTLYLGFILMQSILFAGTFSRPAIYFDVFWVSTPMEMVLTILAVLESFWKVFRSFHLSRWFRFVLPGAIFAALGYSAWQGYEFPPVEASRVGAAIIHAALTSHSVILAVVLLFFVLAVLLPVFWRLHESRFVLGFGVASLAVILGGMVRAIFGARFGFISSEAQPLGYVVALLIWLSAAVQALPEVSVAAAPSEGQMVDLETQLRHLRSFSGKDRR